MSTKSSIPIRRFIMIDYASIAFQILAMVSIPLVVFQTSYHWKPILELWGADATWDCLAFVLLGNLIHVGVSFKFLWTIACGSDISKVLSIWKTFNIFVTSAGILWFIVLGHPFFPIDYFRTNLVIFYLGIHLFIRLYLHCKINEIPAQPINDELVTKMRKEMKAVAELECICCGTSLHYCGPCFKRMLSEGVN